MTALPSPRPRVKAQVAHFLGLARSSEEQLLDALVLFAERHSRDFDLSGGATIVASWPRDHIERLKLLVERYGAVPSDQPERLRAALLSGTRMGAAGSLHDLQDLSLLAEQVSMAWTILFQGGKELHDDDLLALSADAREHTRRTLQWLR
ncbi:MAG: hypothetical protein ACJ761_11215, partial [Chloroflexota bacterium]